MIDIESAFLGGFALSLVFGIWLTVIGLWRLLHRRSRRKRNYG